MGLIIKGTIFSVHARGKWLGHYIPGWISYTHLGCVSTSFFTYFHLWQPPRCGALKNMVDVFLDGGGWGGRPEDLPKVRINVRSQVRVNSHGWIPHANQGIFLGQTKESTCQTGNHLRKKKNTKNTSSRQTNQIRKIRAGVSTPCLAFLSPQVLEIFGNGEKMTENKTMGVFRNFSNHWLLKLIFIDQETAT